MAYKITLPRDVADTLVCVSTNVSANLMMVHFLEHFPMVDQHMVGSILCPCRGWMWTCGCALAMGSVWKWRLWLPANVLGGSAPSLSFPIGWKVGARTEAGVAIFDDGKKVCWGWQRKELEGAWAPGPRVTFLAQCYPHWHGCKTDFHLAYSTCTFWSLYHSGYSNILTNITCKGSSLF